MPAAWALFTLRGVDDQANSGAARIDKWLWAVRIFKTRGLAASACLAGSVCCQGQPVKASRTVRAGEIFTLRHGLVLRTLEVVGVPRSRVGAPLVPQFCVERTPPEEWEKARAHRVDQFLVRERGSGRPTKRDRRQLDELFAP